MTTRLTGNVTVLELEELLELELAELLLELERPLLELDDRSTRDELLLNDGPLELLDRPLDDGALLLDWSPELELEPPPGIELDELLDGPPWLELLDPPGMLLLELEPGMYDDELEYVVRELLLLPPFVVLPPLCPCPQGGAHGEPQFGGYGG